MEKLQDEMEIKINDLVARNCYGCAIDHPSQRQHVCCMMDLDERVLVYFDEAFASMDVFRVMETVKESLQQKLLIQAVGFERANILYGIGDVAAADEKPSSTTGDGDPPSPSPPPPPPPPPPTVS